MTAANQPSRTEPIYHGSGAMKYPDGELKYVWDGRATAGNTAECTISRDEIALKPGKMIRSVLGCPEVVLPIEKIRHAEELPFVGCRFRLDDPALDMTGFSPLGSDDRFWAALEEVGIPVAHLSRRAAIRYLLGRFWWEASGGGRVWRQWRQKPPDKPTS